MPTPFSIRWSHSPTEESRWPRSERSWAWSALTASLDKVHALLARGVSIEQIIKDFSGYFRSLLLIKKGVRSENVLGEQVQSFPEEIRSAFNEEQLEAALDMFLNLYRDIRYSLNPRFELELAISKLTKLRYVASTASIIEQLARLKNDLINGTISPLNPALADQKTILPEASFTPEPETSASSSPAESTGSSNISSSAFGSTESSGSSNATASASTQSAFGGPTSTTTQQSTSHQEVFGGSVEGTPTNNYYTNTNAVNANAPEEISKGFAIASLVMGILSILTCCCGIVGILFGILGIIFFCVQPKDSEGKRPSMATVGLILSIVGLVIALGFMIFGFVAGGSDAYREILESAESAM